MFFFSPSSSFSSVVKSLVDLLSLESFILSLDDLFEDDDLLAEVLLPLDPLELREARRRTELHQAFFLYY